MAVKMSPLTRLGIVFQDTGIWTLWSWVVASLYFMLGLNLTSRPPVSARVVLVGQYPQFRLGRDDVNHFLQSLFDPNLRDWLCVECEVETDGKGVPQSTVAVKLRHARCLEGDPNHVVLLRELAQKLTGQHRHGPYQFRIRPELKDAGMTPIQRGFGSYLTLMQLKRMHQESILSSTLEGGGKSSPGGKGKDPAGQGQVVVLADSFFQGFSDLIVFLSDEEIDEFMADMKRPELAKVTGLLRGIFDEQKRRDSEAMEECTAEAVNMKTKGVINAVLARMEELQKHGQRLQESVERLDGKNGTTEEMAQVSRDLASVMANNTAFIGSVGMLSANIDASKKYWGQLAAGLGAVGLGLGVAGLFFPPIMVGAVGAGLGAVGTGMQWDKKEKEEAVVKKIQEATSDVGIHDACCRLYILTVVSHAGHFFSSGTADYKKYRQLLRKYFRVDPAADGDQVAALIKETGRRIGRKIGDTGGEVKALAMAYKIPMGCYW